MFRRLDKELEAAGCEIALAGEFDTSGGEIVLDTGELDAGELDGGVEIELKVRFIIP